MECPQETQPWSRSHSSFNTGRKIMKKIAKSLERGGKAGCVRTAHPFTAQPGVCQAVQPSSTVICWNRMSQPWPVQGNKSSLAARCSFLCVTSTASLRDTLRIPQARPSSVQPQTCGTGRWNKTATGGCAMGQRITGKDALQACSQSCKTNSASITHPYNCREARD